VRRFEILLEKLNRNELQDLKEEPRSILSSRSLGSSWFIISVLSATSSSSDGTAELFRVSPPEPETGDPASSQNGGLNVQDIRPTVADSAIRDIAGRLQWRQVQVLLVAVCGSSREGAST